MTLPKVPAAPPQPLSALPSDERRWAAPLVRVIRTQGDYLVPWNDLRRYGPLAGMRWEPHPPPAQAHSKIGVSYQAADLATALAEVWQSTRIIDTATQAPTAFIWTPTRPLRLLDVTGTWPLRMGAAAALTAAPRPVCCAWARQIRASLPYLDGLHAHSTMTGASTVALFTAEAFPAAPDAVIPLDSDLGVALSELIAEHIGYAVR